MSLQPPGMVATTGIDTVTDRRRLLLRRGLRSGSCLLVLRQRTASGHRDREAGRAERGSKVTNELAHGSLLKSGGFRWAGSAERLSAERLSEDKSWRKETDGSR